MNASKAAHVLVVDAEEESARELADLLENEGYLVGVSLGASDDLQLTHETLSWDVVLLDTQCAEEDELFERLQALAHGPAVILMARFGSVSEAVGAMQRGAFDYIARPASDEQILISVHRAVSQHTLTIENERLRASLEERFSFGKLVTSDPKLERLFRTLESVADTHASILICGESGTGKSLLARAIHAHSVRRDHSFVVVNCGALPANLLESELFGHARGAFTGAVRDKPGMFEVADGGTIFLDEIATASPDLQVKLLRVLQEKTFERVGETKSRTVDVRLIAASNCDLQEEVRTGRFREDLYYRIHVISVDLPPLRERLGDVPLLAEHFLSRFQEEYQRPARTIDNEAMARLCSHNWPGNVRELENAVERAILLATSETIEVEDLDPNLTASTEREDEAAPQLEGPILPLKKALEEPERRLLERALKTCRGNRQRTAAALGINRTTLFNKMRKYELFEPEAGDDA